jgi:hypothetical protein
VPRHRSQADRRRLHGVLNNRHDGIAPYFAGAGRAVIRPAALLGFSLASLTTFASARANGQHCNS